MSNYDVIILGTGHNALVLQAYLSRSGLKTLSVDRSDTVGGGLATVENPRHLGFFHNTHSFFHRAIDRMPWYSDLELQRHGARYIEPELNVAMLLKDGRSLQWWTDIERTAASFAQFSIDDADSLRRWAEEFAPIVDQILVPEAQSPPLPADDRINQLNRSALGRRLLEVQSLSPLEFVTREFRHDAIRAGLLFFNGLREVDLRLKGFGHSIPALLASRHKAQMCVGGSIQLANALDSDIREHSGKIRTGCQLSAILVENGSACGIELEGGERIHSELVVSGLNPQQTFLQLLDQNLAEGLRQKAANFQYNLLAPLFALNVCLHEAPAYTAAQGDSHIDNAFMVIMGLDRFRQFDDIVACHEAGKIPQTVMWGACPTLFDPSQAPASKHTAFMWEKLPYHLHGEASNWETDCEPHGSRMLELWQQYTSNMSDASIIDHFVRSPVEITQTLPNMHDGDLLVGSFDHQQIGANRPFAGAGNYRTPIDGLYLCGGSTHPGGNITGLCGYNAARVICADLSIERWWSTSEDARK